MVYEMLKKVPQVVQTSEWSIWWVLKILQRKLILGIIDVAT